MTSIPQRPFGNEALTTMEAYGWPGNVRELKFAVERVLCVARGDVFDLGDLPAEVAGPAVAGNPNMGETFDEQMTSIERGILQRAMDGCDGSQKDAAAALGLTYDRFRHILRKHGLTGP